MDNSLEACTREWQRSSQRVLAPDKLHPLGQFVQDGGSHSGHDPHAGHHVGGVRHLEAEIQNPDEETCPLVVLQGCRCAADTWTPYLERVDPTGPMLKGITYIVRPNQKTRRLRTPHTDLEF